MSVLLYPAGKVWTVTCGEMNHPMKYNGQPQLSNKKEFFSFIIMKIHGKECDMENNKKLQLILLVIVIIGIWIFAYNRYREIRPPRQERTASESFRTDEARTDRRPSPDADRREAGIERIREAVREDLNLTQEQERQLEDAIFDRELSREERRQVFEDVLTPEQQERIEERRQEFRSRMADRMSQFEERSEKLLSDTERRELREMMESRMEEWRERRGRGRGRREER